MTGGRPGVVLVGLDGSEEAAAAISTGERLARALDLELVIGHVLVPLPGLIGAAGPAMAETRDEVEACVFLQAARALGETDVRWRFETARADPVAGLHALADRFGAVMIVVGTRGGDAYARLHRLVGRSVSARLAHAGRYPVLIVPPTASESPTGDER